MPSELICVPHLLFEGYDKCMDVFDVIFKNIDQTLNCFLIFNEVVTKTRSINNSK